MACKAFMQGVGLVGLCGRSGDPTGAAESFPTRGDSYDVRLCDFTTRYASVEGVMRNTVLFGLIYEPCVSRGIGILGERPRQPAGVWALGLIHVS